LGIQPPLGELVEVRASMWKITVAFPLFHTDTSRVFAVRLAELIWNLVMYQIAVLILFFQSFRSPTCG